MNQGLSSGSVRKKVENIMEGVRALAKKDVNSMEQSGIKNYDKFEEYLKGDLCKSSKNMNMIMFEYYQACIAEQLGM